MPKFLDYLNLKTKQNKKTVINRSKYKNLDS